MKKAALHNLGCKVNAYETEAMKQQLENNGYEIVPFNNIADIYVINTCTVTNIADRKSRQMLHKAKKVNPNAIVIAVGCYVQAAKDELKKDEAIDIIIGNNKKKDLIEILNQYILDNELEDSIIDIDEQKDYEELKLVNQQDHTRANIKVQDGCNQFCSYCIIPYTRGRVRSRALEDVLEEVESLTKKGVKEVVLTGIHLSSYGIDFEDKTNLLTLIKALNGIVGVKRIRLGSLEPRIIDEEFLEELVKVDKFCPHFHLSLQSGCEETLKRMNRSYTPGQYYDKCLLLRKYYSNPAITTDIIVGFPGETQEEFEVTASFIKQVSFASVHVFKYSIRKGTKAATLKDQIDDSTKSKRSDILIDMTKNMSYQYLYNFKNKIVEVLIEEKLVINNQDYSIGHTKEYSKVALLNQSDLTNEILKVKIVGFVTDEILLAELVNIV